MIIPSPDAVGDELLAEELAPDVCIIGAGAAGISMACDLDGCGLKVLLLEAGGLKPEASYSDYYRGSATAPHPDPSQYRRVVFGGTTGIWGGRCIPFDPIDFERRDYIANSGWPISYSEVARYYPRAMAYCDAGMFDFSASSCIHRAPPIIEGFDGRGVMLDDCIERYSLPTDFGRRYRAKIQQSLNVTALLRSRCVKLNRAAGEDRIAAAEIVDGAGRRRLVHAKAFVLAGGGIEVPRLLLASDPEGSGLGNRTDRVGRYYACHFENNFGSVMPNGAAVAFYFERTRDGVYCRRRLQFSAQAQRQHRLVNTAFRLHFPDYSDVSHGSAVMSAIYLAKSALIPEYRNILRHNVQPIASSSVLGHLRNIVLDSPRLAKFGFDTVFRRMLATRKLPYTLVPNADGSYPLEFNCEQTPMESSRVTLGRDVDAHGLRRVHIDWQVCQDDIDAACRGFLLLRDIVGQAPGCSLHFDEERLRDCMARSVPLGGHHIGTTRMAATPRDGVVDANCAVFDLPNLYVASAAVFPTSSHANPTLTIVAMALRLAAHLKNQLTGIRVSDRLAVRPATQHARSRVAEAQR